MGRRVVVSLIVQKKKPDREAGLFPWSADQQNTHAA
jgi:hypothetical protein